MNLLTVADGFGDSNAGVSWYPGYIKWPEIIQLMTKGLKLHNLSRYGAGNEYIINALKTNLSDKDAVLVQWSAPNRLDLVLSHDPESTKFWQDQISSDPIYNNNIVKIKNDSVWISSGSTVPAVLEYHKKYIGIKQHQLRSQLFVDYAKLLLQNVSHGFMLSNSSSYLDETVKNYDRWMWHSPFQGMCEFRQVSRYAELDLGLVQPIPLIHFDFVRQFIQPKIDLPWRNKQEITAVENMLFRKYQEAIKNRPL